MVYTEDMQKTLEGVERAENLAAKFIGLMGKKNFGNSKGLLLSNTNSIHTFFVFFPIDVVFLDKDFKVVRLVESLAPFRISPIVWKASHTLELPTGTIAKKALKIDDKIQLL